MKAGPKLVNALFPMSVIPLGLEPKTHSLEGCCSIQLSYETAPVALKSGAKVIIILLTAKFFASKYYFP